MACFFLCSVAVTSGAAQAAASARIASLPNMAQDDTYNRRVAAFVGGLVADAAAMPLHWIYDTNEIATILEQAGRTDSPGDNEGKTVVKLMLSFSFRTSIDARYVCRSCC